MTYTTRFVGIDISKSAFDVCLLPDEEQASFPNTTEGIAAFIAFLTPFEGIERLILEPTAATSALSW